MTAVRAIVVAVGHHLRRDRSAVVFLVLLPIGLMVLVGNIFEAEDNPVPKVRVLVESADATTEAMLDQLAAGGGLELSAADERSSLDDAVRRGRIDAGLVLAQGRPAEVVGPPGAALPGGLAFVIRTTQSRVDRAVALSAADPSLSLDAALDALPEPVEVPVADGAESRTEAAIGVLVLVTFMNLIAWAALVPAHRRLGVLGRVGATPVRRQAVLAGYGVAFVATAAVQTATMLLTGRLLLGIEWGATGPVVVLALGLVLAAGGVGMLAGALLPTPEAGSSIGGPLGFALGMLGGCLWPLSLVGGTMEAVGRWVPHNWAVESLRDVAEGSTGLGGAATAALALAAVGLVAGALGGRRIRLA